MARQSLAWLAVLAVACAACGSGDDATDAGSGDAATDAGADTDADADTDSDSDAECTFVVTPEGGDFEACGLRLAALPGSVAEDTTIVVTHPGPTAAPPEGLVLDSQVFALATADGDPEFSFAAYVVIHLPHATGGSEIWVAKQFSEYPYWGVLETCFKDDAWGGIRTASLGTFTILTDVAGNDQPSSGTGDATWSDQEETFSFEDLGFAHFQPAASGARFIDLYGVSESYLTFRLNFTLSPEGAVDGVTASVDGWNNWPGITPFDPIAVTVSEPEEGHLVGTAVGALQHGGTEEETSLSATFDVHLARHFWLSEDPCYWE
jgi:hypothetical protein